MAERGGFEPPMGFRPYRFSRPAHSTTLPPLLRHILSSAAIAGWQVILKPAILYIVPNMRWITFELRLNYGADVTPSVMPYKAASWRVEENQARGRKSP
jgi:hypothetical protein